MEVRSFFDKLLGRKQQATPQQLDDAVHGNPGVEIGPDGQPTGRDIGISGPAEIEDSKALVTPQNASPEQLGPEHEQVG